MNSLKIDRKQDLETQTVAPVHGGKKPKLDSQEGSICDIPPDVVLEEHKFVHEEKKVIPKCNVCNKEFNEVEDLKMHTEVLHRGRPNPGKKPFLCNNCTKKFASKQGLKAHIFRHHVGSRQYSYWYHS